MIKSYRTITLRDGRYVDLICPNSMDIEDAIEAVSEDPMIFTTFSPELKENRDVVMATVMTSGSMLEYVDEFKNDKVVVMAALSNGGVFSDASPELQRDPRMIDFAITHGHVPTPKQKAILARPFDQFQRGLNQNLQKRYETAISRQEDYKKPKGAEEPPVDPSKVYILNNQGPANSKTIMERIRSFGQGGTRRKRTKRTKRKK